MSGSVTLRAVSALALLVIVALTVGQAVRPAGVFVPAALRGAPFAATGEGSRGAARGAHLDREAAARMPH